MPSTPAQRRAQNSCATTPDLPLTVVPKPSPTTANPRIKPSKMGPRRAAVLILIHLVIIAHIIQWLTSGMSDGLRQTLSPVEPSESMFTLETGRVNAGMVMFAAAILSTLIFGRFFCGWACHVVALQDLCGWCMKKLGIHPKPWRTRLLLWAPLILAIYMFLWPTFRREVLIARWLWNDSNANGLIDLGEYPHWLGEIIPMHGFTQAFIVQDFWQTFPPWYVAIPFLLICGFATVYFLGAKAFCTYGCPYGGFFTPIDKLSPLRIRVDHNCNSCGHCTAVCTSNIRVHEQVRNYAAVVDPGCMKCLDCVSVCPQNALHISLGKPAILTKPRTTPAALAKATLAHQRRWDLTWAEEIPIALLFLGLVIGYRSMYNSVPLLMAMGIAAVGSFMAYKSWRLLRDANVRGPFRQLKRDRRITPAGYAFFAATLAVLALGAHGGVMNYHLHRGTLADSAITTPRQVVFTQGYKPTPADQAAATAAINHLTMLRPFNQGGISLLEQWGPLVRLSWLYSVAGDFTRAEDALTRALMLREPNDQLVAGLLQFHTLRQATTTQTQATLTKLMHRWHGTEPLRRALATTYLQANQPQQARALFEAGLKEHPRDIPTIRSAANLMLALGDIPAGVTILRQGLVQRPTSPDLQEDLAGMLLQLDNADEALQLLTQAAKHDPTMPRWYKLAELTSAMGRRDESATALTRARELEIDQIKRDQARAPRKELFNRHAELLRALGRETQARAVEADANQTLARLAARSKASQTRHQP
ncbi:MAG: tetratricopeptide repeat protein [bacterium]